MTSDHRRLPTGTEYNASAGFVFRSDGKLWRSSRALFLLRLRGPVAADGGHASVSGVG